MTPEFVKKQNILLPFKRCVNYCYTPLPSHINYTEDQQIEKVMKWKTRRVCESS